MKEKSVKQYYNQYSNNYDTFYTPIQYQKFTQVNEHFGFEFDNWSADIGGGTGLFSSWVDNHCILTLDISYDMLKRGLDSNRKFLAVVCDMQSLPLRSGCISSIYSFTAIQNSGNHLKVFDEIKRVSSKDVRGIISILEKSYDDSYENKLIELFATVKMIQLSVEDIVFYFS